MPKLPNPPKESIIYENSKVRICSALYPITQGHTIVVWKEPCKDLSLLRCEDYEYLMNMVDAARDALKKTFNAEKVYLIYMDEIKQVHWHLVPRYDEKGFNMLVHKPKKAKEFGAASAITKNLNSALKFHKELLI